MASMDEMRSTCPLYESTLPGLCRCRAVREFVVPTLHEREHYCRSGGHDACPTWRRSDGGARPIGEDAYYQLWLASAALDVG